ncbi:MAG: cyclase family protein [Candidatus Hodarchaeales archaeon]|jgi:arylformamidase
MTIKGDKYNFSKIEMGVHTGTHIDSPLHLIEDGKPITDLSLNKFYGKCKIINLTELDYNETIIKGHLEHQGIESDVIVIFRTKNSFLYKEEFREDYISLLNDGANFLISKKVNAVGIDYLSLGSADAHRLLLTNDIPIYEGLNLVHIDSGNYI